MYSINCKGKLLNLAEPVVMGIVNITADSFYKGHLSSSPDQILKLADSMINAGAAILDIGGQSTRPGSASISIEEEIARVVPVIKSIHATYPHTILSVDTYNSQVARAAVGAGASMVNDIGGGKLDKEMLHTVAELGVPYICMHMQGVPATMQVNPSYKNLVTEILDFFSERIEACKQAGIKDVILDPGFGFGKTIEHNFSLLKNMAALAITGKPILAGLSRKSTVYKTLGVTANEALNGTTALHMIALQHGAAILRAHDVQEAVEAIKLFNAYKKAP